MKYLYIFKKSNGEILFDEETLAYKHIYQSENYREPLQYIGRIDSNEYLATIPEIQDKVKEYKKSLLDGNTELQKALDNGARSGAFTQIESDYANKINKFAIEVDKERAEKLVLLAKKEYPPKDLNISTPGGARELILGALR